MQSCRCRGGARVPPEQRTEPPPPATWGGSQCRTSSVFFSHPPLAPSRRPASRKEAARAGGAPRSGTGAAGSRAEPPAPSDGDGAEHRGPAHAGSRLRLRHFCRKTGLNGGWKSSFLQYLNPASLPARLCSASAFSWSGLSGRREEAREAPGAGSRPPQLRRKASLSHLCFDVAMVIAER